MQAAYFVLIFLVGLIVGSFLNVCIYRLPLDQSVITPPSHCPACQAPVRPLDNIPLLSYLLLRGRCRGCGRRISPRYPLVEGINALGYVFLFWKFGPTWMTLVYALFFSALIVVTFIDLDHQIIPNEITLPGMVAGVIAAYWILPHGFWNGLIGLLLGGGLFYLIAVLSEWALGQEGMGGGDIKLIAMIGAFLGWQQVLLTIFIGAFLGSVAGIFLILVRGRARRVPIPFGPFLSAGALAALFWGREILTWYLGYGWM